MAIHHLGGLSNHIGSTFRENKSRADYILQSVITLAEGLGVTAFMINLYTQKLSQFHIESLVQFEQEFLHIKNNYDQLTPEQVSNKVISNLTEALQGNKKILNELVSDTSDVPNTSNLLRDLINLVGNTKDTMPEKVMTIAKALTVPGPAVPSKETILEVISELNTDGSYQPEHLETFAEELHNAIFSAAKSSVGNGPMGTMGAPELRGLFTGNQGQDYKLLERQIGKRGEDFDPTWQENRLIDRIIKNPVKFQKEIEHRGMEDFVAGITSAPGTSDSEVSRMVERVLGTTSGVPGLLDVARTGDNKANATFARASFNQRMIKSIKRLNESGKIDSNLRGLFNHLIDHPDPTVHRWISKVINNDKSIYSWARNTYSKQTAKTEQPWGRMGIKRDLTAFNQAAQKGAFDSDLIVMDPTTFFDELVGTNEVEYSLGTGKEVRKVSSRVDADLRKSFLKKMGKENQYIAMRGADYTKIKELQANPQIGKAILNLDDVLAQTKAHVEGLESQHMKRLLDDFATPGRLGKVTSGGLAVYKTETIRSAFLDTSTQPLKSGNQKFYMAHLENNYEKVLIARSAQEIEEALKAGGHSREGLQAEYASLKVFQTSNPNTIKKFDKGGVHNLADEKLAFAPQDYVIEKDILAHPSVDFRYKSNIDSMALTQESTLVKRLDVQEQYISAAKKGKEAGQLAFAHLKSIGKEVPIATDFHSGVDHQIELAQRFLKEGGISFDTEFTTSAETGFRTITELGARKVTGSFSAGEIISAIKKGHYEPQQQAEFLRSFAKSIKGKIIMSQTGVDLEVMLATARDLQNRGIDMFETIEILNAADQNYLDQTVLLQVAGLEGSVALDNLALQSGSYLTRGAHSAVDDVNFGIKILKQHRAAIAANIEGLQTTNYGTGYIYDNYSMSPHYGGVSKLISSTSHLDDGRIITRAVFEHQTPIFDAEGKAIGYTPGTHSIVESDPRTIRAMAGRSLDNSFNKEVFDSATYERQARQVRQFNPLTKTFRDATGKLPGSYELAAEGTSGHYLIAGARHRAIQHFDEIEAQLGSEADIFARAAEAKRIAEALFDDQIAPKITYGPALPRLKTLFSHEIETMATNSQYAGDLQQGLYGQVANSVFGKMMGTVYESKDPIARMNSLTLGYSAIHQMLLEKAGFTGAHKFDAPRISVGFGDRARVSIHLNSDMGVKMPAQLATLAGEVATYAVLEEDNIGPANRALLAGFQEAHGQMGQAKYENFMGLMRQHSNDRKLGKDLNLWKTEMQGIIHETSPNQEIAEGLRMLQKSNLFKNALITGLQDNGGEVGPLIESLRGMKNFSPEEATQLIYNHLKDPEVLESMRTQANFQHVEMLAQLTPHEVRKAIHWANNIYSDVNGLEAKGLLPRDVADGKALIDRLVDTLHEQTWADDNPFKGNYPETLNNILKGTGIKDAHEAVTEATKAGFQAVGKEVIPEQLHRGVNAAGQSAPSTFLGTEREAIHTAAMMKAISKVVPPMAALGGIAALMAAHNPAEPELRQGRLSNNLKNSVAKNSEIPGNPEGAQRIWYGEITPFMLNISFKGFVRDKKEQEYLLRETYNAVSQKMEIINQDTFIQDKRQKDLGITARDVLRRNL